MAPIWRWTIFAVASVPTIMLGYAVEIILDTIIYGEHQSTVSLLPGIWFGMLFTWACGWMK